MKRMFYGVMLGLAPLWGLVLAFVLQCGGWSLIERGLFAAD